MTPVKYEINGITVEVVGINPMNEFAVMAWIPEKIRPVIDLTRINDHDDLVNTDYHNNRWAVITHDGIKTIKCGDYIGKDGYGNIYVYEFDTIMTLIHEDIEHRLEREKE